MQQERLIQIRHVPDEIHRVLKARAAAAGMTLSDYLLDHLTQMAKRPTLETALERIRQRKKISTTLDSAAAVRAEREFRE